MVRSIRPTQNVTSLGPGNNLRHTTARWLRTPDSIPPAVLPASKTLAQQYRFFHWHLEFPGIFTVPEPDVGRRSTHRLDRRVFLRRRKPALGAGEDPGQGVLLRRRPRRYCGCGDRRYPKEDDCIHCVLRTLRCTTPTGPHCVNPMGPLTCYCTAVAIPSPGRVTSTPTACSQKPFRTVTAPTARPGVITPSGLATDKTTAPFFADTLSQQAA